MSEGTARELVMKAMADFVNNLVDTSDPAFRYTPEQFDKEADAVLAALQEAGALAPAGLTLTDLDAAQRDVAEALRMATQAGIGFEQGMPNARRLAADADRKAIEAFRQLRALVAPAADAATGAPS